MSLGIGDNFKYQGKKPNFERDSFALKAEMKAFPEANIDEGHLSFCKEDGKRYEFRSSNSVDPNTGKWREFKTSADLSGYPTKTEMQKALLNNITDYNVSKHHPTEGIGGTNKFTLETAIKLIPESLRSVGIKCSFLDNADNSFKTYKYFGSIDNFTNTNLWMNLNNQYIESPQRTRGVVLEFSTDKAVVNPNETLNVAIMDSARAVVSKGDIIIITGHTASVNATRLWVLTDANYKVLDKANEGVILDDFVVTATEDGYIFYNSRNDVELQNKFLIVKLSNTYSEDKETIKKGIKDIEFVKNELNENVREHSFSLQKINGSKSTKLSVKWVEGMWDEKLSVVTGGSPYRSAKIDISSYAHRNVSFYGYMWFGFIMNDGSYQSWNKQNYRELEIKEIPYNAIFLCVTQATSLPMPHEDIIINEVIGELPQIKEKVESIEKTISSLESKTYDNIEYNRAVLSSFFVKYNNREVDNFNQLTIALCGDSILGRQDKGASWDPASPEMELTPDSNGGVGNGYETGHYPPNMWEKNIAYKLLSKLQFKGADVKYYNHVASEIKKNGDWIDKYPAGADCLRVVQSTSVGNSIIFSFTGACFAKAIFTQYGIPSVSGSKVKLSVSSDNGASFVSPTTLNLVSNVSIDESGKVDMVDSYKWFPVILRGFEQTKNYQLKIEHTDGANMGFWGFETWSNPRINIVVNAEGGNTFSSQEQNPIRFSNEFHNQDLIIFELPYLNDFNVPWGQYYKGEITCDSPAPVGAAKDNYWLCTEIGNYSNFGNIYAGTGDYIEYTGSGYKLGSSKLKEGLNGYIQKANNVFNLIKSTGIPMLTLVTHDSVNTTFSTPPYIEQLKPMIRNLVLQHGLASIDVNAYIEKNKLNGYWADGTHLNDKGVQIYIDCLQNVFDKGKDFVFAQPSVQMTKQIGAGSIEGDIKFKMAFKKEPVIRVYNNPNISISNVTRSGFTAKGTGTFDWEAYVL